MKILIQINLVWPIIRQKKTILKMIPERINSLINAPNEAFNFGKLKEKYMNELVYIYWGDDPVGYLEKGDNIFSPKFPFPIWPTLTI